MTDERGIVACEARPLDALIEPGKAEPCPLHTDLRYLTRNPRGGRCVRVAERREGEAAETADFRRYSLANLALHPRVDERGAIRVRMDVDKTRRDTATRG